MREAGAGGAGACRKLGEGRAYREGTGAPATPRRYSQSYNAPYNARFRSTMRT